MSEKEWGIPETTKDRHERVQKALSLLSVAKERDALLARVERLEKALRKIAATSGQEAARDPEILVLISKEALSDKAGEQ